jgi:hypothetical protein
LVTANIAPNSTAHTDDDSQDDDGDPRGRVFGVRAGTSRFTAPTASNVSPTATKAAANAAHLALHEGSAIPYFMPGPAISHPHAEAPDGLPHARTHMQPVLRADGRSHAPGVTQ